jgi:hypothetical protein
MEFISSSILKVPPLTLTLTSDSPKLTTNDQRPASQPAASSRRRRRRRQPKKLNYQRIYIRFQQSILSQSASKLPIKWQDSLNMLKNQHKIAYNLLKLLQTKLSNLQTSQNSIKELKTSQT